MSDPTIFVRFTVAGFHHWPDAPPHRAYLAQHHRHLFHVQVRMPVKHAERELEFHDLLDQAHEWFPGGDLGAQSCETMAAELGNKLARFYQRTVEVTVSEDGEVGATVVSNVELL
jgi:hypothetical protein